MKTTTKIALAVSGAVLSAGLAAGMTVAAKDRRGEGWQDHGAGLSRGMSKRAHFGRAVTKDMARERARMRFARFDENSDGVIDATEIDRQLTARREKRRARRMRRRADKRWQHRLVRMDQNRDGKISKPEFVEQQEKRFARFDLNNDGRISQRDLPPRLRDRGLLDGTDGDAGLMRLGVMNRFGGRRFGRKLRRFMLLRGADTNDDGVISRSEFLKGAERRFARQDNNGDGAIDATDRGARQKERRDYRIKRFIHRFGIAADKAGHVTRKQFEDAAALRFARWDLNNDGSVTRDERPRRARRWRN